MPSGEYSPEHEEALKAQFPRLIEEAKRDPRPVREDRLAARERKAWSDMTPEEQSRTLDDHTEQVMPRYGTGVVQAVRQKLEAGEVLDPAEETIANTFLRSDQSKQ